MAEIDTVVLSIMASIILIKMSHLTFMFLNLTSVLHLVVKPLPLVIHSCLFGGCECWRYSG